jgi:hypothetical protein
MNFFIFLTKSGLTYYVATVIAKYRFVVCIPENDVEIL